MKFQTRLLKNLVKSLLLPSLLATCLLLRTALEPRSTDSTRLPAAYTKKKCGLRVVFCRKLLATGYASEVTQASDLEVDFFKRGISELPPYPIPDSKQHELAVACPVSFFISAVASAIAVAIASLGPLEAGSWQLAADSSGR